MSSLAIMMSSRGIGGHPTGLLKFGGLWATPGLSGKEPLGFTSQQLLKGSGYLARHPTSPSRIWRVPLTSVLRIRLSHVTCS